MVTSALAGGIHAVKRQRRENAGGFSQAVLVLGFTEMLQVSCGPFDNARRRARTASKFIKLLVLRELRMPRGGGLQVGMHSALEEADLLPEHKRT